MCSCMAYEFKCEQPTKTKTPCQNAVAAGALCCSAGHLIPAARWRGLDLTKLAPSTVDMEALTLDDVLATPPAGVANTSDDSSVTPTVNGREGVGGQASHPLLGSMDNEPIVRRPYSADELRAWSHAMATNPDVIRVLRDEYNITPAEAALRVVDGEGHVVTLVQAVEAGDIEAYDAPVVVATWPGQGWSFEGDQFRWVTEASIDDLAGIYRAYCMDKAASSGLSDDVVAAQLAGTIGQLSSSIVGADLFVTRTPYNTLTTATFSGVDGDFLESAVREAERTLRAGRDQDPFGQFRSHWLGQLAASAPAS